MPKQYLDDNGNPVAAPSKQYLDDSGNPITPPAKGAAPPPSELTKASARLPNLPGLSVSSGSPNTLPKEGSIGERFGPGVGGYVEAGRQGAEKWLERNAPIVMGTIGGLAGGIPGAAVGGALGGAAQDPDHPVMPAVKEGATQAGYELGGKVLSRATGKLLAPVGERLAPKIAPYLAKYPFLKGMLGIPEEQVSGKAVQHLTAAAAEKGNAGQVVEEIGHTIEDIEQELTKVPEKDRTVKSFLNGVNKRKDAMNLEKEAALAPVADVNFKPTAVAKRIRDLVRPYMAQSEYKTEKDAIEAAAKNFDKGWTFGQLDALRTDLGSQLSKHKAKGSVAKYVAEKGDLALSIDNAILDGLRETVYPTMDQVAGKPAGYFEQMGARQSSLIHLQQVLEKRVKDLQGAQATSEATPRFAPLKNISIYAHAGAAPRGYVHGIQDIFMPPREYRDASRHVAEAFVGPKINEQPYRVLFSTAGRVFGPAPRRPMTTNEYGDPANFNPW